MEHLQFNDEQPWDTEHKLPDKSRRRRLLERISRFRSSLSLRTMDAVREVQSMPPQDTNCSQQSISCISFASGSDGDGAGSSRPCLPRTDSELATVLFDVKEQGAGFLGAAECGQFQQLRMGLDWCKLPDEVKIQILGWLDPMELVHCSSVSKEWHALCFDGQLWRTLDASGFYDRIPVEQLSRLIVSVGSFVRNLNLRGCLQLKEDWRVETVANACQNLIFASLEGCNFERNTLHGMITKNTRLVHLNISGLSTVSNSTCRMIAHSCPTIETLDVSFCTNADGHGLRRVAEACKNLRQLRACQLKVSDMNFFQAIFRNNTMEKLYLGDCNFVSDECIRIMVEGVEPELHILTGRSTAPPRKLVYLDLGRCRLLTDAALRHLAGNVPLLEGLEISGLVTLTDLGLAPLLETVPRLSHLDMEECGELSNSTLSNIARSPAARTLVHLQVSGCENMGDTGMVELLRCCTKLKNLEMDNTRVSDQTLAEAAHVIRTRSPDSDRPVTASAASKIALRLVVFDCASITWTGIREILTRNAEAGNVNEVHEPNIIQLKCFHEYQRTVDEHTKLVLRGDLTRANAMDSRWAEYMMSREETSANRRRRRRQREAAGGLGTNDLTRRRGRVGCTIM